MLVRSNMNCQTGSNCEYLETLAAAAMTFVIFAITYYILTYTTSVQIFVRHTFKCLALLAHGNFLLLNNTLLCSGMFMIYLYINFHLPNSNDSLGVA